MFSGPIGVVGQSIYRPILLARVQRKDPRHVLKVVLLAGDPRAFYPRVFLYFRLCQGSQSKYLRRGVGFTHEVYHYMVV